MFAGEVIEQALEDMSAAGESGQPMRNISNHFLSNHLLFFLIDIVPMSAFMYFVHTMYDYELIQLHCFSIIG